ncbi:MAG: hypothetical protein JNL81_16245 [Hyphomonadaceae bacterium]|nr:hypothetical protein [Hyphomonadaceae bacterium]
MSHEIPALLYEIIQDLRARNPEHIPLIGVAGAQGSGKSYQCRLLATANQPRFAHFSLDDVYLSSDARGYLAAHEHPLFVTRGAPGTHDLYLAQQTIWALRQDMRQRLVPLPRFDKATDNPVPENAWPLFQSPAEAIVMDGWCLGATPVDESALLEPINDFERTEDRNRVWRGIANEELRKGYGEFFQSFDAIVYLRPPNWEIVPQWRRQAEEQLRGRPLTKDELAWLDEFMSHYERITRSMMAGHHRAKCIVHLDEARNVLRVEER